MEIRGAALLNRPVCPEKQLLVHLLEDEIEALKKRESRIDKFLKEQ